jgi:hypothetical protein
MQIKRVTKMLSAVLSAAMLITSVPTAFLAETVESAGVGEKAREENLLKIWFDEPVSQGTVRPGMQGGQGTTTPDNIWQQLTLPIGNSMMGANIYGEIAEEHLTFNQKTLWNGGPSESRPNYNGGNKQNMIHIKELSTCFWQVRIQPPPVFAIPLRENRRDTAPINPGEIFISSLTGYHLLLIIGEILI